MWATHIVSVKINAKGQVTTNFIELGSFQCMEWKANGMCLEILGPQKPTVLENA